MSLTYEQAVDEMLALLKTAWDTTGYDMLWPMVGGKPPVNEEPWARATVVHADGAQASLSGEGSRQLWRNVGTLIVQVFVPIAAGYTAAYPLAKTVADAFRGKRTAGGAWFKNVRINEQGHSGAYAQLNVLVDFDYDESVAA